MNYTMYLSSTLTDLEAEREAVRQALSDECVIKHSYLASERALVDSCLEDVAKCDAYILILGLRYGYVPEAGVGNPKNLSITEVEYERASNKPRLVFIKDEELVPFALTDAKTKEHPLERIESFRKRVSLDQRAAVFKTADDLKLAVVKAFNAFKEDREVAKPLANGSISPEPSTSRSTDAIRKVLAGCYKRSLFTRTHAQLSLDAMFDSIANCRELVQSATPEVSDPELAQALANVWGALDGIERIHIFSRPSEPIDVDKIDQLKLQALRNLRLLSRITKIQYAIPDGRLTEEVFFSKEDADKSPTIE